MDMHNHKFYEQTRLEVDDWLPARYQVSISDNKILISRDGQNLLNESLYPYLIKINSDKVITEEYCAKYARFLNCRAITLGYFLKKINYGLSWHCHDNKVPFYLLHTISLDEPLDNLYDFSYYWPYVQLGLETRTGEHLLINGQGFQHEFLEIDKIPDEATYKKVYAAMCNADDPKTGTKTLREFITRVVSLGYECDIHYDLEKMEKLAKKYNYRQFIGSQEEISSTTDVESTVISRPKVS